MLAAIVSLSLHAGVVRVATYNLENYLDQPTETRPHAKSPEARAKIRECIRLANPDLLALQEMGSSNALLELRASLQTEGQSFPFFEFIECYDTNIHVAVLSKLPIVARRPHTNDSFLLDGRRFQVKRGFAELDLQAGTNFTFTLIAAHLKSHLATADADEAQERLGEARILRGIIDARLATASALPLVVLGDFNDGKESGSTKEIIGRGRTKLFDTRPAERNGDHALAPSLTSEPRNVAWTYFYGKTDEYSRIDFILVSPAMKRRWLPEETLIPVVPDWGVGSDHRLIVAGFQTDAP
ncbi:MAG TPA: endonuclease/exonuclease/phosphatase family protein [Verrucomicrobiae bacterium]